jgi:large subunit ribosomal protein L5
MEQLLPRLQERYKNEIISQLKAELECKNPHQIPKLEKVVVNIGLGKAVSAPKLIDSAVNDLERITGQKAVIRRARKSIANFKLREGMPIGVSVTLRRERMYEFVDRLFTIALPRVRDFRGVSRKGFDGRGNFSMGVLEQIIFPEIDLEKTELRGLGITFVTTAQSDKESEVLLEKLGMPFRK